MDASYLLPAIAFLAYAVQTTVGFAAALVCLSLGAQLYPLEALVVAVAATGCLQSTAILARHRREVHWRLLGRALPLAVAGLALGVALRTHLDSPLLHRAFALFVILSAAFGLLAILRGRTLPLPGLLRRASLAAGGMVHGLFATGGPLVVLWANAELDTKEAFRATLAAFWLAANLSLLVAAGLTGDLTRQAATAFLLLLPGLAAGFVLGEALHARAPERLFRAGVHGLLLLAGLVLLH